MVKWEKLERKDGDGQNGRSVCAFNKDSLLRRVSETETSLSIIDPL
jgi:hypothetical protein